MNKLFGIPMTNIMVALLIVLAAVLAITVYIALRNPVIFRLGIRNVPRRKAQTGLIVVGLMLSTLIMSAAFATGDTINYSIGDVVYKSLGRVDEVIQPKQDPNSAGQTSDKIPAPVLTNLETRFKGDPDITGFVPTLGKAVPVLNLRTLQSEPIVSLAGVDAKRVDAIGGVMDTNGNKLDISTLKPGEVYLNQTGADKLQAQTGDTIQSFYNNQPISFTVAGIVRDSIFNANTNGNAYPGLLIPLDRAQTMFNRPNDYDAIFVANTGTVRSGVNRTDAVVGKLDPVLAPQNLEASKIKQDNVKQAELFGNVFTTFFLVLGLFAIAAGVLLIFLIFTMLAAERKSEMGMARAIGTQRRHLVQMFIAEGTAYDLIAAAVGAILGVGAALGIVFAMKAILGNDLPLSPYVQPRSLIIAYCLGVVLTFGTIAFSSWRVSNLNIVAAIRDTAEPVRRKAGRKSLIWGIIMVVVGVLLALTGLSGKQAAPFYGGAMLIVFGLALILRRFGVPERGVFTAVGLFVLVWWCVPFSVHDKLWGKLQGGIEMFFFSGIALVTGAVLLMVFNSNTTLKLVTWLGKPFGRYAPAFKTGVAYPMANRGRTGMTLAMFGLIIFALVVISTMNTTFGKAYTSAATLGGWDVAAATNDNNPVGDFKAAVQQAGTTNTNDWTALGVNHIVYAQNSQVRLAGVPDFQKYAARGLDSGFIDHSTYTFQTRATGYASDRAIWDALKRDPTLAVIDASAIPQQGGFGGGNSDKRFQLTGVKADDKTMQPIAVDVRDPQTGKAQQVTIIGVLDQTMNISDGLGIGNGGAGLLMNDSTFQQIFPTDPQNTAYFIALKNSADSKAVKFGIKAALVKNGVQAIDLRDELQKSQQQSQGFLYLLQGFLGIGLFVGIAALGVVALRSVVERRQQIGMLRALGYQRGMVSATFLIESLFIAVSGVVVGVATGMVLSRNLIASGNAGAQAKVMIVPYGQIALFVIIALVAAFIMTVIPARRASRVPIAEALRYE
ncbi:MAG: ABC transporter permease [Thermomicrobiales bacterium]